jgi:ABC-2 type transport system ATP-binding protein
LLTITVESLSKTFQVPERPAGLAAALKSLTRPGFREVPAVQEISFTIPAGEMVGFLGPNGAGKTTTLKMLSGLLQPSQGLIRVGSYIPGERSAEFLRQISMVLGNKSQLLWDISALDTYRVLGEIYRVPPKELQSHITELSSLLEMEGLLDKPVRNLSLGERMKCELVAALLHQPAVLFLDEPTLGLDVSMQRRLRGFIREYNIRTGATVILTSHYMADVTELCQRVLLIQGGRLLFDGQLDQLSQRLAPFKLIHLSLSQENGYGALAELLPAGADLLSEQNGSYTLSVACSQVSAITAQLLRSLPVADLTVENPPIEAVIDQIYQGAEL